MEEAEEEHGLNSDDELEYHETASGGERCHSCVVGVSELRLPSLTRHLKLLDSSFRR